MVEDAQLLNPKQVAEILGVHQKTVHLWLRSGKLQGTKISYRAWRIPKTALDAFIVNNSNTKQQQCKPETNSENKSHLDSKSQIPQEGLGKQNTSPQSRMKHYIQDIMGEPQHRK